MVCPHRVKVARRFAFLCLDRHDGDDVGDKKRHFAFLVGNGLSVAYNDALSVAALREELLATFSGLSGGLAEEALAAFADRLTGEGAASFENLLGPV